MQQVTFINKLNESITFSINKPFLLASLDGFSSVTAEINSIKGYSQDGSTYNSTFLDSRQLVIGFSLLADSKEDLMLFRDRVIRVFNPKLGEGELYYSYAGVERKIKCTPESVPKISLISRKRDCVGEVVLIAHNPYFTDVDEKLIELTTWTGGLNFPLNLPFSLKQKGENIKNIYNDGHVDTPVEIIFKGPAIDPRIENKTTGEFIQVNRELTSEDTLYITTEYGNKKVEIERNGVRDNAFNYINLNSTFFSLELGDNLIEYSTKSLEPKGVSIKYYNRYLGI